MWVPQGYFCLKIAIFDHRMIFMVDKRIYKRRLVAFKGGFVGPSVCRQNIFKKFWKREFVNPIDMMLVSIYEETPEQFLPLT